MANEKPVRGEDVAPEQRNAEGEPSAPKDGESVLAESDLRRDKAEEVHELTPAEETLRQQAEQYPSTTGFEFFGQHEEGENSTFGHSSTARSRVGRVVIVHEDTELNGEVYKAGAQDIEREAADSLIADGLAFEPAGKKRGR